MRCICPGQHVGGRANDPCPKELKLNAPRAVVMGGIQFLVGQGGSESGRLHDRSLTPGLNPIPDVINPENKLPIQERMRLAGHPLPNGFTNGVIARLVAKFDLEPATQPSAIYKPNW